MATRSIATSWWFGDALILVLCAGIVLVAAMLAPSAEAVSLLGAEVPVLCGWRRVTGIPCPGCGLTRSFTFMAHGDLWGGFRMNPLGPPMFLFTLSQVPWRLWKLGQGYRKRASSARHG